MRTALNDWLIFLRDSDPLLGVPLIVGGIALMLFGWRMWRECALLAFALIGYGIGAFYLRAEVNSFFPGADKPAWMCGLPCALALGAAAYPLAGLAVAVLGGLLGAGGAAYFLADLHVSGAVYWLTCGFAMVCAGGYTLINRRLVVIVVTAVIGAFLVLSGVTAVMMMSPGIYGTMRSIATGSVIALPFMILVPTVMSCFYQVAEVNRLQIEL